VEKYLKSISEKSSKVDEVARLIDADCMFIFTASLHG
jgi:hypothetical protein